MEKKKLWTRYFVYIFLIGNFLFFSMLYLQPYNILKSTTILINPTPYPTNEGYLVSTPKCMIPDLDPWNEEIKPFYKKQPYVSCNKYRPITYVVKNGSSAILHLDKKAAKSYSKKPLKCCYINVTRDAKANVPDDDIAFSQCKDFQDDLNITGKIVTVKCRAKSVVYSNTHAPITITQEIQKKMSLHFNQTKSETLDRPLNVLFIGIDSISRLNFIRTMPKTHEFLENTEWIEYKGYNKIGDNTFPNLIAVLTGKRMPSAYNICRPDKTGGLDTCNFIWFDYRDFGYVTAYAEDESTINTFNYHKKGFMKQPTDYYLRSYAVAVDRLNKKRVDEMDFCTGPETSGERILNVAKDFATTFIDYPSFGFFWMNSFSHNKLNSPTRMDDKVSQFFEGLYESGYFNNSVIIFLSDHGLRFGDVRATNSGWLEERLPFLYFWFPKWFQEKYPREYSNLRRNAEHQLTTPYDLYMTVQDILRLFDPKYAIKPSEGCALCKSLFEKITPRSCEEVGIDKHWCTCYGYQSVNTTEDLVKRASKFIVDQVNLEVSSYGKKSKKCAKYSVSKIIRAGVSLDTPNQNETYLLVVVKTSPEAILESTITVVNGTLTKGSYLSRLDKYHDRSQCVNSEHLKKYCYCK